METSFSDDTFPTLNEVREVRHRIRDTKQRAVYCRELLARLPSDLDADSTVHILSANVYLILVETVAWRPPSKQAEELYASAFHQAELSEDDPTNYWVHFHYGMYLCRDLSTHGTPWIQKALKYARTPHEIANVLTKLAEIWASDEATSSQALFLYDWACSIEDAPLSTMTDKYRCMVQHGLKDEVGAIASRPLGDTCEEIAEVLAARLALGRKKTAIKAAEIGLDTAQRTSSKSWEGSFKVIVMMNDPSMKQKLSSLATS